MRAALLKLVRKKSIAATVEAMLNSPSLIKIESHYHLVALECDVRLQHLHCDLRQHHCCRCDSLRSGTA